MKHRTRALPCLAIVFLICSASDCRTQTANVSLDDRLVSFAIELDHVPLSVALGRLGVASGQHFVLFGIEEETANGVEPSASAHIEAGASLDQALRQVLSSVPGYSFTVVSPHLINVFPSGAPTNPNDVLNLRITKFELAGVAPSSFLGNPQRYLPELKAQISGGRRKGCLIGPGFSDKAPGISLEAEEVTVRQALNRVSQMSIDTAIATSGSPAFGWLCLEDKDPTKPALACRVHDVWSPNHAAKR